MEAVESRHDHRYSEGTWQFLKKLPFNSIFSKYDRSFFKYLFFTVCPKNKMLLYLYCLIMDFILFLLYSVYLERKSKDYH